MIRCSRSWILAWAAIGAAAGACSIDREGVAGGTDAGRDASPRDGSVPDAPPQDVPDPPDALPSDAPDAGESDGSIFDASCTPGVTCVDATLRRCIGGTLAVTPCALGCSATEPRCATLVPSNVGATDFDPAASDVVISGEVSYRTNSCPPLVGALGELRTQGDGSTVCLLRVGRLLVEATGRLRLGGRYPLIVLANGDVTVDGLIDGSATGSTVPGGGGALTGTGARPGGAGTRGGALGDGGGGGGALCGDGGRGGDGAAATGGAGGSGFAAAYLLTRLAGGSGGGSGAGDPGAAGVGGAGGGALQISSRGTIAISGTVDVGGGGGGGGRASANSGSGGGGGSGGGVLLEAALLTFSGSGAVLATGGAGGGGAGPGMAGSGTNGVGSSGRVAGGPSGGVGGSAGGDSGGGAFAAGLPGDPGTENGGGGGGGTGCIVLRNASGTAPAGIERFSPSGAPALRFAPVARE